MKLIMKCNSDYARTPKLYTSEHSGRKFKSVIGQKAYDAIEHVALHGT